MLLVFIFSGVTAGLGQVRQKLIFGIDGACYLQAKNPSCCCTHSIKTLKRQCCSTYTSRFSVTLRDVHIYKFCHGCCICVCDSSCGQHGILCEVKWRRFVALFTRLKLNQLVQESVRIITILLRKWCHNNEHFSELAPHHGGKTADMDMVWRNHVTVTLCLVECCLCCAVWLWPMIARWLLAQLMKYRSCTSAQFRSVKLLGEPLWLL